MPDLNGYTKLRISKYGPNTPSIELTPPHQLSFWLKTGAILLIITQSLGTKSTGLFNIALQLSLPLSVLTNAFNNAWSPNLYKKLSNRDKLEDRQRLVRITWIYFLCVPIVACIYTQLATFFVSEYLAVEFYDSLQFLIYLTMAAAFDGMYLMVVGYIFYVRKTQILSVITTSTSLMQVLGVFILVPHFGVLGVAKLALLFSFLNFVLVWWYSNKVYRMPWFSTYVSN